MDSNSIQHLNSSLWHRVVPWGQGWMRKREQQTDRERERRFSMLAVTSHWVSSSASGCAGLLCSSPEKNKQTSLCYYSGINSLSHLTRFRHATRSWSHVAVADTSHVRYNQFQTGLLPTGACSHLFTLVCPRSSSYVLIFMRIKTKINKKQQMIFSWHF